jgi:chemotaxis protein methyltransferase WspC
MLMSTALDDTLSQVLRLLAKRAGMASESLGDASILHALRKRISASGAVSPQDYLRRLAVDPAEFQELLEDLVVPETWFFRDALAFRCLARRLDATRSLNHAVVRVLSVGCSTGEEVYSLAIALREAGLQPAQFFILGTDVSRRWLDLAQKGRFTPRSFRERDETLSARCERWCERVGESWQVCDELHAGVEFHRGNLAQGDFLVDMPPFDVIFCRNVLIYFHAEARRTAIGHLKRLLSPDGLVCSAPAEARIFSEAGFCSIGRECPFAFRRQDELADVPGAAPGRWPLQAQSQPLSNASTLLPLTPSRPVVSVMSPSPGPDDADVCRATSAGKTTQEEVAGHAILHAAQQAADNGRLEEADALCGQVLSRDPASAEAHYLRGVVRQAQGLMGEAQRSLEKALYLDPKHYQTLVHLMLLATERGDQPAAANYRRRAQQVASPEAQ